MADVADAPLEPRARHITYCGVCTLPPEYCEFGGTSKKCEEWLEKSHPDLHQRLYSEGTSSFPSKTIQGDISNVISEALNANLSTLSVSARERAAKDAAKKEAKAAAAETRDAERKAAAKVQIKRVERNKRKFVTVLVGIEAHGLDLKKVAKELGKKFATGSSVTKSPAGTEEITIQGDVSDDLYDWLVDVHGKEVPEDNIELIEDKKKKAAT